MNTTKINCAVRNERASPPATSMADINVSASMDIEAEKREEKGDLFYQAFWGVRKATNMLAGTRSGTPDGPERTHSCTMSM